MTGSVELTVTEECGGTKVQAHASLQNSSVADRAQLLDAVINVLGMSDEEFKFFELMRELGAFKMLTATSGVSVKVPEIRKEDDNEG